MAFESVTPTLNRPGQLHFTVGSQDIKAMLSYPGSRYEGLVTVVFDSELLGAGLSLGNFLKR